MDCEKCGVYNPEDRDNCWRCGAALPKQAVKPKRDSQSKARMWLYIGVGVFMAASLLRMCGVSVPGFPGASAPTGLLPQPPAIVQVVSTDWL